MRRRHWLPIPLIFAALIAAFQYFNAEKVTNPETGRVARVALSTGDEKALGLQTYAEVLAQSDTINSGREHDLVVAVAQRLVGAIGSEGKDFEWQVSLVRSDQANAFCLPGGKIVVYSGILPYTRNEAGLAAVMGHEIAHAIARHGSQRMLQSSLTQTVLMGAQMSFSDMDYSQRRAVLAALGAGAQFGVLLPFSRHHESEADAMGLTYMARAGFDPHEAISFWQRMDEKDSRAPPEFASTHPSNETRIEQLRELMPKADQEYQKYTAARTSSERTPVSTR